MQVGWAESPPARLSRQMTPASCPFGSAQREEIWVSDAIFGLDVRFSSRLAAAAADYCVVALGFAQWAEIRVSGAVFGSDARISARFALTARCRELLLGRHVLRVGRLGANASKADREGASLTSG